MSSLAEWLSEFRRLHDKARLGRLAGAEIEIYRAGRDELARALLAAQRLHLKAGEVPRRALRVARALQVDVDFAVWQARAVTIDLSTGGFSCLLAKAGAVGEEARFSLRIPGSDPLAGRARVQDAKALQGNFRVAFEFLGLPDQDKERIELFVFDTVLSQLAAP